MLLFFRQIRLGADPGRSQSRSWRGGGSFLLRSYSSDLKATATNRMHSSDLEAFGKKSNFGLVFDAFLDLFI